MPQMIFGDGPDSWLISNESRVECNRLPATYGSQFSAGNLSGMHLPWIATGPSGLCFLKMYDGRAVVSNVGDLQAYSFTAAHVTFSSWGGWWLRNKNGSVVCGGNLPATFMEHTSILPSGHGSFEYVFFGHQDLYLARFKNGQWGWGGEQLPNEMESKLQNIEGEGWVLGQNCQLCHYDARYYFLHFIKGSQHRYFWNVDETGRMSDKLIKEVVDGVGRDLVAERNFTESVRLSCQAAMANNALMNQASMNINYFGFQW